MAATVARKVTRLVMQEMWCSSATANPVSNSALFVHRSSNAPLGNKASRDWRYTYYLPLLRGECSLLLLGNGSIPKAGLRECLNVEQPEWGQATISSQGPPLRLVVAYYLPNVARAWANTAIPLRNSWMSMCSSGV